MREDFSVVAKIITGLRIGLKLLGIPAIGLAIYAGFQNWTWYIFIPAWACLWFLLRLLSDYCRKLASFYYKESEREPIFGYSQDDSAMSSIETGRGVTANTVMFAAIAMLAASGFWYGIGRIARLF